MSKFYSLKEMDKLQHVQYKIIFGERSNGKSYAVNKRIIDNFFNDGGQCVIMKRFEEDMKSKICSTVFSPLEQYILEKYDHKIKFYQGKWLLYHKDSEGKLSECLTLGYALAINTCDRLKMSQYPNVTTISFEEFMSQTATYLQDELNLFLNVVSTIVRNRTNVQVYLLGNAISKSSPYATALNIRLHRMAKGEIIVKEYKNKKGQRTKFAIERTENVDVFDTEENTNKIVYNIFGNSGVGQMITTGDFETHNYNMAICNVTFSENLKKLPKGKYRIVSNKDRTNLLIKYEDYIYCVYRVINNGEVVFAFREIDKTQINKGKYNYILNNKKYFNGLINIVNLNTYTDKYIDVLLDEMMHSYKQDKFIFLSNDNGEDVNSAFNQVLSR